MSALRKLLRGKRRCAADEIAEQLRNEGADMVAGMRVQRLEVEKLLAELAERNKSDV